MAQPVQANSSSKEVNEWLNQVIKKTDEGSLQKELRELQQLHPDEQQWVKQLSLVFTKYGNGQYPLLGFKLDSKQLYNLLLIKWNHYQTTKGMAKAPIPETLKPASAFQVDKFGTSGQNGVLINAFRDYLKSQCHSFLMTDFLDRSLVPMSGGIAIGAP